MTHTIKKRTLTYVFDQKGKMHIWDQGSYHDTKTQKLVSRGPRKRQAKKKSKYWGGDKIPDAFLLLSMFRALIIRFDRKKSQDWIQAAELARTHGGKKACIRSLSMLIFCPWFGMSEGKCYAQNIHGAQKRGSTRLVCRWRQRLG